MLKGLLLFLKNWKVVTPINICTLKLGVTLQNGILDFFDKDHTDNQKGSINLKGFTVSKGNTDSRIILKKLKTGILGKTEQDTELVIINDEKNSSSGVSKHFCKMQMRSRYDVTRHGFNEPIQQSQFSICQFSRRANSAFCIWQQSKPLLLW